MKKITPSDYLALREGATVLEADGHGDKVLRLADGSFLKLFRRKRLISSASWSPYAKRFADNAAALARRGIPCPVVIEVFRIRAMARDGVHYHPLAGRTLREVVRAGLTPADHAALRDAFNHFVRKLHDLGLYFRSLHLGNVVLTPAGELGLIDISDLRVHGRPLNRFWRKRNLLRLEGIADEAAWLDYAIIAADESKPRPRSFEPHAPAAGLVRLGQADNGTPPQS